MNRKMRKTALTLLALACALQAGGALADGGARGQFRVWAIGLPNGYLVMDRQSRVIQVTTDHRSRGAGNAPGDALVTNQVPPARVADFQVSGALIRAVGIDGVGQVMELAAAARTPGHGETAATVPGARVAAANQ
jgi:hypothetical protein